MARDHRWICLILGVVLLASCAQAPTTTAAPAPPPPTAAPRPTPDPKVAEGSVAVGTPEADRWRAARAERLGLSVEAAGLRDQAMEHGPGDDGLWWDEQLAAETHELWERLCKECHHGSRKREKVLAFPPPPRDWARTPTRFFTWDHEPRVAFEIVMAGAKARPGEKDMPAWKDQLSREQVWGLIYFVNRVSVGKKSGLR